MEGATVSCIAAEAGLSPGNVYRRFPDKDALMRAVFSCGTAVNKVELEREVDAGLVRKVGIRTFTQQWIAGMLSAYRARAGLMRATVLYAQQHERTPFVRRQRDLEVSRRSPLPRFEVLSFSRPKAIFRGFRTAEALRKCPSFISVYRPLSLQPIESCSKGLENGDHCGRGFSTTFNENIFGFELGAFRVENFRERTYAAVETDCGRVCGVLAGLRCLSESRTL